MTFIVVYRVFFIIFNSFINAARAAVRVVTRASRGAGPPDWFVTAGPAPRARTQVMGPAPGPVSPRSDRRVDLRCVGPVLRQSSDHSRRGIAVGPSVGAVPVHVSGALPGSPGPRAVSVGPQVGY